MDMMFNLKIRAFLIGTVMLLCLASCSWQRNVPEIAVPEIVYLESRPDIHSAQLFSSLRKELPSDVKCGFYLGKDQCIMDKIYCNISGRNFSTSVYGLEEKTLYWYKSFIGNGFNEICTDSKYFRTEAEPELPADFNVEVRDVNMTVIGEMTGLSASLSGNTDLIKSGTFRIGRAESDYYLTVEGTVKGSLLSANIITPVSGSYRLKASVTDGVSVKESEIGLFDIETDPDPVDPSPDPPVEEFNVSIENAGMQLSGDMVALSASLSGDVDKVKTVYFHIGQAKDQLYLKFDGIVEGGFAKAYITPPDPGIYWFRLSVSDGQSVVESEVVSFEILKPEPEVPLPEPEPQPEFTVQFTGLNVNVGKRTTELSVTLSGDLSKIKYGTFSCVNQENNLPMSFRGKIYGNSMTAIIDTPLPGIYMLKAEVTSDGIAFVTSEEKSFEVKPNLEPKPEFTVSVGRVRWEFEGKLIYLSAVVSGEVDLIEKSEFWIEDACGEKIKLEAGREGSVLSAFIAGLMPGVYKVRAVVSDGLVIKQSEVMSLIF